MSSTATPSDSPSPAAAPSVTPPAENTPPAAPTLEQIEQAIADASPEELERAMTATAAHGATVKARQPVEQAAAPAEEAPAAPAETPPAAATPPAETEEAEPAAEAGKPPQFRIRGRDDKETQFLALIKAGKTVPEATATVYGVQPAKAAAAAATPPPAETPAETETPAEDPAAKIDAQVADIDTKLATVRANLKKANEDMDADQQTALQEELADLKMAKLQAQQSKQALIQQAEQSAQQAAKSVEKQDMDAVVSLYPELGQKGSPERAKFDAFVKERSANSDYDGIFASPKWRSFLAREWAELEGVVPVSRRQATPPAAPAVTPPRANNAPPSQPNRPRAVAADAVGAREAPSQRSFEQTPADAASYIENLTDPTEIERLMNEVHRLEKANRPAARR